MESVGSQLELKAGHQLLTTKLNLTCQLMHFYIQ